MRLGLYLSQCGSKQFRLFNVGSFIILLSSSVLLTSCLDEVYNVSKRQNVLANTLDDIYAQISRKVAPQCALRLTIFLSLDFPMTNQCCKPRIWFKGVSFSLTSLSLKLLPTFETKYWRRTILDLGIRQKVQIMIFKKICFLIMYVHIYAEGISRSHKFAKTNRLTFLATPLIFLFYVFF